MKTIKIMKNGRLATRKEICKAAGIPEHSPAPWEYIATNGEDPPRVLSKHVNSRGNFYVATCNVDEDARLIAAAPELLAACLEIAGNDKFAIAFDEQTRVCLYAAIKKAEFGICHED